MLPDGIRRLFRLGRAKDVEAEVDAELAFHLDTKTEALIAGGMSPEAARAEALRQFGDVRSARAELVRWDRGEAVRRSRVEWGADWWMDLRHAVRGLRRTPGVAISVVVMFGLGIGGASAMFGLLDRLLLRVGPDIAAPNELRRIYINEYDAYFSKARVYQGTFFEGELRALTEALPRGYAIASMTTLSDRLGGRSGPEVPLALTSGDAFHVLGTRPYIGRLLEPSDDTPSSSPAAIISYGLWRRHFGGDPAVLGKVLVLGSEHYTIVGVAPSGFSGLQPNRVDAWVPMRIGAEANSHYGRRWQQVLRTFPAFLRVPSDSQARALVPAMQRAYRAYAASTPRVDTSAIVTLGSVVPYKRLGRANDAIPLSLIVAGVAAILCCIAVANVTNLLLLRAVNRQRETAVRMALGAGRSRLMRGVLIESILLALVGAAAAMVVAAWGGELLRKLIVDTDWQQGFLDARLLVFAGGLGLVIGLVTGFVPGWQASRPDAIAALKAGVRAGATRSRLRVGLLALQAALTVVLLAGLGLYTRSFLRARATDYGVAADRLINVDVRASETDSLAQAGRLAEVTAELAERIRLVPGVAGVAQASISPIYGYGGAPLRLEGADFVRMDQHGPFMAEIDTAFLAVTGLHVLRGRGFSGAEVATRAPVALVNDAFVRKLWPGQEPLGKCLFVGMSTEPSSTQCRQVVGVVSNYRNRLREEAPMQSYYLPLGYRWDQGVRGGHALVVRTDGPPERLVAQIRGVLRQRLPDSEPEAVMVIGDIVNGELDPWRAGTTLFALFAGLAIVLAVGGLYSLVAYGVTQRAHEFGIRIAVGARDKDIARLVLATALRPVVIGLVCGTGLTLWLARYLAALLYETTPRDPVALISAGALLLVIASVACVGPVRTAMRTDPRQALQAE